MKITEETYFDYIDNLLSSEEKAEFETYLQKNPEAQNKVNQLKNLDDSVSKNFSEENLNKITNKFSNQFDSLQKNLDKKNSSEEGVFTKIFQPIFAIPNQSKAFLLAIAVGIFFIGDQELFEKNDQFLEISKSIVKQNPVLFEDDANGRDIKLPLKNGGIIATPMKKLTLRSASLNEDLECPTSKDSKQIKIIQNNALINESYYFYCGDKEKKEWELNHIEIKMGSKPIDIDGRYKIVSEDDYIYLFPKK